MVPCFFSSVDFSMLKYAFVKRAQMDFIVMKNKPHSLLSTIVVIRSFIKLKPEVKIYPMWSDASDGFSMKTEAALLVFVKTNVV